MFGRSRPVVFDPYRHQRRRRRLPVWLWTLLLGLVAGAVGTVVAQQRWLPERLSAADSARLRTSLQDVQADRDRLQGELQAAAGERDAARTDGQTLQRAHDALAARAAGWDEDLAFLVDALPPDPREGEVAVRAVRAVVRGSVLHYALALSHDVVQPASWKRHAGIPPGANKRASIATAVRLMPDAAPHLTRIKDDGRAEALLLARQAIERTMLACRA